jgi:hypothetical protein
MLIINWNTTMQLNNVLPCSYVIVNSKFEGSIWYPRIRYVKKHPLQSTDVNTWMRTFTLSFP